jgi:uncharacterized protein
MNEILNKAINIIIDIAYPDKIILFGSRASGITHNESDIDLLVLKKGIKRRRKLAQLLYNNFTQIGAPIDIIVNELSEYEELKKNPFLIYNSISKEGKVIYDKSRDNPKMD